MTKIRYIISTIITVFSLASCYKTVSPDLPDCDYNARIVLHYNEENTAQSNRMTAYADKIDAYIFDKDGLLQHIERMTNPGLGKEYILKPMLEPGNYSIVAIANVSDKNYTNALIKQTTRDEILMRLNCDSGVSGNGDKLYGGYRTFSVVDNDISDVRVDMIHAHCSVNFRIRWKTNAPELGEYSVMMKSVPSKYYIMPEYVQINTDAFDQYHPAVHDKFSTKTLPVKHYLPTVPQNKNIVDYVLNLNRNSDEEIKGRFITYRIKDETRPTMSLHVGRDASGEQIMKDIDLKKYFDGLRIPRTFSLKQEYNLDILIDGDQVFVTSVTIGDWNEGGSLGS